MYPEEETKETERSTDRHFNVGSVWRVEEQMLAGRHKVDTRFLSSFNLWLKVRFGE